MKVGALVRYAYRHELLNHLVGIVLRVGDDAYRDGVTRAYVYWNNKRGDMTSNPLWDRVGELEVINENR